MARRAKGGATVSIAAMGIGAILGGVLIGGGPGQGRAERRDEMRRSDLWALEAQLDCLARKRGSLDARIETTAACPDQPQLTDRETGEPYRIEQIDDENLRLCASFEIARGEGEIIRAGENFDAEGCRVMNLPGSSYRPEG
ncbi:hypothetical protein [Paracoccus marinaquae]|uniref:Uncharacterized protein n=1 Tax=Paracoccus marinaquae TaxID=2841926 RepID=A0ABS6AI43_9RHOB|nr:hypothetical protein [Paracoccus marinaquae]MBU3030275.1 hypothetical protein [Paracoccus marinaquae]